MNFVRKTKWLANLTNKVIPYYTEHLYRNAIYLMARTGITSFLGFFFWLIVARVYSEVEVGYSSAIISALNLCTLISLLGLNASLIFFLARTAKSRDLINSAFTLGGLASIIVAAIFVMGLRLWSPGIGFVRDNILFMITFIGSVAFATLSQLSNAVFIAARMAIFALTKDIAISLLKIVLAFGFSFAFHSFGIVSSWGLSLGVGFAVFLLLFVPKIQPGYKPALMLRGGRIREMWMYSGYSYLISLLSNAPILILPLFVLNLLGVYNNAYFYIAWMIANLMYAIPSSVADSFFAENADPNNRRTIKENLKKSLKLTYLIIIPVLIVVLLASQWLLSFFGSGYVVNATRLLWLLSCSSLFLAFSEIYISFLRIQNRLNEILIIKGLILLFVLTLSYMAIPATGIVAIGYVWLGVQAAISIILFIRLRALYN